jgi:hypothetical protein
MIGKINKDGCLCILRAGRMRIQSCPRNSVSICGDGCPLFGEPRQAHDETILTICDDRDLRFERFADERRKP